MQASLPIFLILVSVSSVLTSSSDSCSSGGIDLVKMLTPELKNEFEDQGYLVFPRFWAEHVVDEIRNQAHDIVLNSNIEESRTIFSTDEQSHASDDYFLGSGDKIRFFWEEDAFDEKGDFRQEKMQSINKMGHALHDLDPVFKKHSYASDVAQLAVGLGLEVPLLCQSMYIFKQPRIGGKVLPHQDGTFLFTDPPSVIGLWWALEDCSKQNGCLWVVPGSHKQGVSRWFQRKPGGGVIFEPPELERPLDIEGAVPLEVPKGSLVVLHGAVVHYSEENRSEKSRHAYTLHVIEGKKGYTYPKKNWLQRPADDPFKALSSTGSNCTIL